MSVDDQWLRLLSWFENLTAEVRVRSRRVLPFVARLCLTATFLEDAWRMWWYFHENLVYLQTQLNWSELLSVCIVSVNLVGQLLGSVLVLLRMWMKPAVTLLAGMVLLQVQMHFNPWKPQLILRSFALLGGLLLLHVESEEAMAAPYCSAGIPLLINRKPQHLMRLMGRVLLACMYRTLFRLELHMAAIALNVLGVLLMSLIFLGYRTRLAALALALLLMLENLYANSWWFIHDARRDIHKYQHFHTLSVVGGLLHVVVLGPGKVSLEQYKKLW